MTSPASGESASATLEKLKAIYGGSENRSQKQNVAGLTSYRPDDSIEDDVVRIGF